MCQLRCDSSSRYALLFFCAIFTLQVASGMHIVGSWNTKDFFKFLVKFGVQKTNPHNQKESHGYIFGNITSRSNVTNPAAFAVLDRGYFLEYYGNRSVANKEKACARMFNKVSTMAFDEKCFDQGEDFLRKVPCPKGQLCVDEDIPWNVIKHHQFTFIIEDLKQPRFWYISMVACYRDSSCQWHHLDEEMDIDYDIWLVNGSPNISGYNPFLYQFSVDRQISKTNYLTADDGKVGAQFTVKYTQGVVHLTSVQIQVQSESWGVLRWSVRGSRPRALPQRSKKGFGLVKYLYFALMIIMTMSLYKKDDRTGWSGLKEANSATYAGSVIEAKGFSGEDIVRRGQQREVSTGGLIIKAERMRWDDMRVHNISVGTAEDPLIGRQGDEERMDMKECVCVCVSQDMVEWSQVYMLLTSIPYIGEVSQLCVSCNHVCPSRPSLCKQDTAELYLVFFLCYVVLVPLQLYAATRQKHPVTRLFTASLLLEFLALCFILIHVLKFAFDGVGVGGMAVAGDILDILSRTTFMLLLLLLAKGWAVTRMELTYKPLVFAIWFLYGVVHILLYVWNMTEVDIVDDIDEYQTWPGWLIIVFRTLIMVWFLYELRNTMMYEHNTQKLNFFLHFGASALVWFIYLPIIALIALQVSALWRFKLLLGITYSADCLAYCVMTHLLWPARSEQYFLLAEEADLGDELDEFNEAPHVINNYTRLSEPPDLSKIIA
uniref:GPR180/TMEM145 transmembrane domain-containing protein n=1 Tax=Timema monikensis TaxID=170555 RepID=A0A7R9HVC1_9NEOP|nr:unnamed protein product [Timema monikensis]